VARVQKTASTTSRLDEQWHKRLREAAFLLLLPLAIYLLACFFSYLPSDPGWSHAGDPSRGIHNFGGAFGSWIADLVFYLIGVVAYALPLLLLVVGAVVLRGAAVAERSPLEPTLRLVGFVAKSRTAAQATEGSSGKPRRKSFKRALAGLRKLQAQLRSKRSRRAIAEEARAAIAGQASQIASVLVSLLDSPAAIHAIDAG